MYGTLVEPRQLTAVLGHSHRGEILRARLHGYHRVTTPAYEFPFVVRAPEASVDGVLVMDLGPEDLRALDEFEDVAEGMYCRVKVEVEAWGCGPFTPTLQAETYVAGPRLLALVDVVVVDGALNRP